MNDNEDAFGLKHDRPHKEPGRARPANITPTMLAKLKLADTVLIARVEASVARLGDAWFVDAVDEAVEVYRKETGMSGAKE